MAIQQASFIELEDGTRAKKAGSNVYEGQPLTLQSDGTLAGSAVAQKVYGISKFDSNTYADRSFDAGSGAFGSGQLTVIQKGILLLGQSIYSAIEIYSNTTTASAPVTVKIYDDTKTYHVNDPLYVDATGLISNDGTVDHTSLLGLCLSTPLQNGGFLEVLVNPGVSSVAADLK